MLNAIEMAKLQYMSVLWTHLLLADGLVLFHFTVTAKNFLKNSWEQIDMV